MAALKPSAIREIFKSLSDPDMISFAAGNPAAESFPAQELSRLAADIFAHESAAALQYGITEGYAPLRAALSEWLLARRGIGKSRARGDAFDDEVMIVSGGQQGIELAARVLCDRGDTVLSEEPTFIGALNAFRSLGAIPCGIETEEDGLSPAALEAALDADPRVKLLYLIPNFQNPSGRTMSLEKRRRVLEIAQRRGLIILEDDPYGELRFAGKDIPTIKSMDTEGNVIYCSSFSKILSAGMRVGFVSAPAPLMTKMATGKQCEDVHSNLFFQMLCYRYMTECDLDGHIRDIQAIYRRKCALMSEEIARHFPAEIEVTHPEGGLFLYCTMPKGEDALDFAAAAMREKVAVVPGNTFSAWPEKPCCSFRLNYSTPTDDNIKEGVARLGKLLRARLARKE